ncbi:MAG: ketoacyl-ACP synthase III [Planctomycetota bacterium]
MTIEDIAYHLPEQVLDNKELLEQNPEWDMPRVERRAGVFERRISAEGETALDLAVEASKKLLAASDGLADRVDAIVFCTQSPDYLLPPNACLLHGALDLPEHVLAFDVNQACSGYVYGLVIAQGLIVSGAASDVLLVTADTYTKYLHENDRSTRVLFGDGAAVSWIRDSKQCRGIVDVRCATGGKEHKLFYLPAGGCRLPRPNQSESPNVDDGDHPGPEYIQMDGIGVLSFVCAKVPDQVEELLQANGLGIDDVDLFVFHQASKIVLDSLARFLDVPPEKLFVNMEKLGNTVSASIPIAVKDVMTSGRWQPGKRVVLSGFGAGLSWASAILEI